MYFINSILERMTIMKEKKDGTLIVKVPKELLEKFNNACKENSINRSQLIRNYMAKYAENVKD